MTIDNMAFVPATGLRDTATYPTKPLNEASLRDGIQDQSDQVRDYINNELLVNLPIDYAQIADVLVKNNATLFTPTGQYNPATKKYVDDVVAGIVLGQIPDGSVSDVKLSNVAGQIKDVVNTHLAENVQQLNNIKRICSMGGMM